MSIYNIQGWQAPLPTPMVRLCIFLIIWTLQPHFTLQMSARTLQSLFEGVCMPQYFRNLLYLALTRIGLSVSTQLLVSLHNYYPGCNVVPSVTG